MYFFSDQIFFQLVINTLFSFFFQFQLWMLNLSIPLTNTVRIMEKFLIFKYSSHFQLPSLLKYFIVEVRLDYKLSGEPFLIIMVLLIYVEVVQ